MFLMELLFLKSKDGLSEQSFEDQALVSLKLLLLLLNAFSIVQRL
jgi:hypothetical protein